uniref:Reverse transcriptase domain-containing protein n=1 Tax=Oreochromis niloticus TaxID=8128 RepID=A0A669DS28_ORENI
MWTKLFASILSKRLESIFPELIDLDQTGFVSNRQTQDNLRRTLQVMNHITSENISAMLISLDAQKAFDSVGWEYLFRVLARFGFKDGFIKCIKVLYYSPTARIRFNGHLSQNICLKRGTRQGCPLSSSLFALCIEPLAQAIRENSEIKGIMIRGEEHKTCMFADDVLLFITNPESSLFKLMALLKVYNQYSGYKLNIQKTQSLTFNYTPLPETKKKFNFKWDSPTIKYLGVNLTKDMSKLYENNYGPINKEIKSDMSRWSLLPLDMSNRIEIIKMNVLPRILYLFQSLPLEIPQKQFDEWDRWISRFIWNSRRPRVQYKTLQLKKEKGGRALPCLQDYYYAAQLKPLVNWCSPNYEAKWKTMEIT